MDYWNDHTLKEKVIIGVFIILTTIIIGILIYFFIEKVLPIVAVTALLVWALASDHIPAHKEQQIQTQPEGMVSLINLYEETARVFLPILREYKVSLGINPTTINSIYSYEKCTVITNLAEPALIYSVERKFPVTMELSDLELAIQTRFNQEGLWLYLISIDQRNSQFLKFFLLPVTSENAFNWAMIDTQKRFQQAGPKEPGNRKDKDF